jgi:hypothetical protein
VPSRPVSNAAAARRAPRRAVEAQRLASAAPGVGSIAVHDFAMTT